MENFKTFDLSETATMTGLIDVAFSEMNIGLLIYQMEDLSQASSLKCAKRLFCLQSLSHAQ
jgi:hypothetical protein